MISFDILDYIGKHNNGILTLISLKHEEEFYEGTFFYTDEMVALTPDPKLEEVLGCVIEDYKGYNSLVNRLLNEVQPYKDMIEKLEDFKPNDYGLYKEESNNIKNK